MWNRATHYDRNWKIIRCMQWLISKWWCAECRQTWSKLENALCRLACMPVGGSLVILIDDSSIPWGMMCDSAVGAGSALINTRKFSWLSTAACSSFFSSVFSQRATKCTFCNNGSTGQTPLKYLCLFVCLSIYLSVNRVIQKIMIRINRGFVTLFYWFSTIHMDINLTYCLAVYQTAECQVRMFYISFE